MSARQATNPPSVEQQPRYLAEASRRVQEQGFYAKKAMGAKDLIGALRHASDMLRELRTSLLTPRNYYELYMKVCDELRNLDAFFQQLVSEGTPAADIYERAQACGDVLPRLYLLITAGAVYVKTLQAPAKDILHDLVEMAKGVQHPMRGLFLRHYLAQACRDALPDTGSPFERDGGDVSHAVDFILRNFGETNRLWVRMQNQGPASQKKRREEERKQLKILVGTNLVRLSQLEGVDEERYARDVLPPLLEQVVNCRDAIAQPYLLDCIINVFPDEFHLVTLDSFLVCCTQLRDKVSVIDIIQAMMRRLANPDNEVRGPAGAFDAFDQCASKLVEEKKGSLAIADLIKLRAALLEFAVECYPGELEYVQRCLSSTSSAITVDVIDDDALELETLLLAPLASASMSLESLLALDDVAPLCRRLPLENRKTVARRCLKRVLAGGDALESPAGVGKLCAVLEPLLAGDESQLDDEALEAEQSQVARLAHLCRSAQTDDVFRVLGTLRRALGKGGSRRTAHTLPALAYRGLELARAASVSSETIEFSARKIFQFVHETATALAGVAPARALRVFLAAALEADAQCLGAISYEFVSQAFILYEDELPDSKAQVRMLRSMVGTLLGKQNCDAADYDALAAKATQYAAKLFRKPDQCQMVAACSHLFWPPARAAVAAPPPAAAAPPPPADGAAVPGPTIDDVAALVQPSLDDASATALRVTAKGDADDDAATAPGGEDADAAAPPPPAPTPPTPPKDGRKRDAKRVLECLQRSLKTADACMTSAQPPIRLFVEILDHYLAHLHAGNPLITPKYVAGLVALITEHVETMEAGEARAAVERHYANTRALITARGIIELEN